MADEAKKEAKIGEFKGNPVISLPVGGSDRYPFTFGLSKARAVIEFFDDIKKFVDEHEPKEPDSEN